MRRIMAIIIVITLCAGMTRAGQLDEYLSVDNYFASNRITANNYFDTDKLTDDEEDLSMTGGDIYDFDVKSTKRAFFYSLILPGAGQYYAGSRYKPLYYLGAEALIWTGYFIYHGKGSDKKKEYQNYADDHYYWPDFMQWWNTLTPEAQDSFSHRLPWDEVANTVIRDHEYYENIGKYDQFQIGWDDIDQVPYSGAVVSDHRGTYLNMRKTANDYYQNASTMLMLALGNRIVSAFEAALTAKKYNKGAKRFSFNMKAKDFGNGKIPILTYNYEF
jgi:hypothetical protein